MNIKMYDCGFGDCFALDLEKNMLYIDFGIHIKSKGGTLSLTYQNIITNILSDIKIKNIPADFLLTHYHEDHYSGLWNMIQYKNKFPQVKFDNIYIPDIWNNQPDSIYVILLILLGDLFRHSVIRRGMTLIDFLCKISRIDSKVFFVKRGSSIENEFIALWPDIDNLSPEAKRLYEQIVGNENIDNNLLNIIDGIQNITKRLLDIMIKFKSENEPTNHISSELLALNKEFKKLLENQIKIDQENIVKLNDFGNDISIVFHNKEVSDRNILFTGDITSRSWRYIESVSVVPALKLHKIYSVIKVPHHGTRGHYHDFSTYMNENSYMLIPNGDINKRGYKIYKQYSEDINAKEAKAYCSNNNSCNAKVHRKCNCNKKHIIAPKLVKDI